MTSPDKWNDPYDYYKRKKEESGWDAYGVLPDPSEYEVIKTYDSKTGRYTAERVKKKKEVPAKRKTSDSDVEILNELKKRLQEELAERIGNKTSNSTATTKVIKDTKIEAAEPAKENNTVTTATKKGTKKSFLNFNFGANNDENLAIAMDGKIAVKRSDGVFATFDGDGLVEVIEDFTMNSDGAVLNMPVTRDQLKPGDLLLDGDQYYFVKAVTDKGITSVNPRSATNQSIVNVKNMFGFNFYTKVVSVFAMNTAGGDASNPFGANPMLPFLLMGDDDGDDNGKESLKMMAMMGMMGGQNAGNNPMAGMLPFLLMSDKDDKKGGKGGMGEMAKMMMFSQIFAQQGAAPKS